MTGDLEVQLWIPRRVPSLNELLQAKSTTYGKGKVRTDAYDKLEKSWAQTVKLYAPRFLKIDRCSVHFEIREPDRRRDPDGFCTAAAKLILDGLVKSGVLAGDGWAHIAGLSFSWRVGKPPGVRVVLTPVAEVESEKPVKAKKSRARRVPIVVGANAAIWGKTGVAT